MCLGHSKKIGLKLFKMWNFSNRKWCALIIGLAILCSVHMLWMASNKCEEIVALPSNRESWPWYYSGGKYYPNQTEISGTGIRIAKVLPDEGDPLTDRFINQLMFVPPNIETYKLIYLYGGREAFWIPPERDLFSLCPVKTCKETKIRSEADMVVFQHLSTPSNLSRLPNDSNQVYLYHVTRSPARVPIFDHPDIFNWTVNYRHDATNKQRHGNTNFGRWIYYDPNVKQIEQKRNYAQNKTKKVAWFVSNCLQTKNNRMSYANELAQYIQVDIYGNCGNLSCPMNDEGCYKLLENDYKFYLAFENSNCKEYITEKFYVNALKYSVLPIVMGAPPEEYKQKAPYKSYIHVEDFLSPKELAAYLHELDQDDELYNSYFQWKGTGEVIFVPHWCQTCAMLHDQYAISRRLWYSDFNKWSQEPSMCTSGYWRDDQNTN